MKFEAQLTVTIHLLARKVKCRAGPARSKSRTSFRCKVERLRPNNPGLLSKAKLIIRCKANSPCRHLREYHTCFSDIMNYAIVKH